MGRSVKSRTILNLTNKPKEQVEAIAAALKRIFPTNTPINPL